MVIWAWEWAILNDIYTVGYEGLEITAFLDHIERAGVQRIIDIRWTPISRKRGFSKNAFQMHLAQRNISYFHIPQLGSPKPLRESFARSNDWLEFAREYDRWLEGQATAISLARHLTRDCTSGLLCFEANVKRCHRYLLMERLLHQIELEGCSWKDLSKNGVWTLEYWSPSHHTRVRA